MHQRLLIVLAFVLLGSNARADTVTLANGDTLTGEIVEWAVDHLVIEHEQLGTIRLSLDQLKLDTGKPPRSGLFDTGFLRGWKRTASFGMNGEVGESMTIQGGLNFGFKGDFKRWELTGRYYYNLNQNGENDNNSRIELRRDWLIPTSKWFTFASFRHQYDDTESWKNRFTVSAGPGYQLLETETTRLSVLLGPSYVREQGDRRDNRFESVAGIDFGWKINEKLDVRLANNFFTQIAPQAGDLRNLTVGQLSYKLSEAPSLSLVLNSENEYEFSDEDGVSNRLNYGIALAVDF